MSEMTRVAVLEQLTMSGSSSRLHSVTRHKGNERRPHTHFLVTAPRTSQLAQADLNPKLKLEIWNEARDKMRQDEYED